MKVSMAIFDNGLMPPRTLMDVNKVVCCIWADKINRNSLVTFKSVYMGPTWTGPGPLPAFQGRQRRPSLPGSSFLRLIYGGVLPPPADPLAFARGQGFPP